MATINVGLDRSYYEECLGADDARKLPESVIRDAESSVERYLLNHSEEFQQAVSTAIDKSLDENEELLRSAGINRWEDNEDDEDDLENPLSFRFEVSGTEVS